MPPLGKFDPAKLDREVENAVADIEEEPEQIDEICKIRKQFHVEDGSRYYALLQAYLNSELTLTQATEQFYGPIYRNIARFDFNEMQMTDLWHSILHFAKRISYRDTTTHQRLVDFLHEIKHNTCPANISRARQREVQQYGIDNMFRTLHGFSYRVENIWADIPGHGSGCTVPEIHAWANLNFFLANVVKAQVYDLSAYCIRSMRVALEEDLEKRCSRVFRPMTAAQMYDALVPAAAVWVFSLRKTLYEMEVDLSVRRHSKAPREGGGGEFYQGPNGFNKERWGLWKRRFGEIAGMRVLREETRDVAREAWEIMEENEKYGGKKRYNMRPRKGAEGASAS